MKMPDLSDKDGHLAISTILNILLYKKNLPDQECLIS